MPTQRQQPSIVTPLGGINREWAGMGCVAVHGDVEALQQTGIGQVVADFRTAYVMLRNRESEQRCGAIVKKLTHASTMLIEADLWVSNS